jgi:tripartite-type tricarboxylate transporter receptor subunit TctC
MQTASVRERLHALGVTQMIMTSTQFDAFVRNEISSNAGLVKAAGIVPG